MRLSTFSALRRDLEQLGRRRTAPGEPIAGYFLDRLNVLKSREQFETCQQILYCKKIFNIFCAF